MKEKQEQHHQPESGKLATTQQPKDSKHTEDTKDAQELAPGVDIVRSSTPRPFSIAMQPCQSEQTQQEKLHDTSAVASAFPAKAPPAPPVPEEMKEHASHEATVHETPVTPAIKSGGGPEFLWLFEYGLEMEAELLNSPECLNGAALQYGPAVLKGYSIMPGTINLPDGGRHVVATIVPGSASTAEVWGVLYRIPQRVTERSGDEPSLLNIVHTATTPLNLFRPVQAIVHDMCRDREIACITYVATDDIQQELQPMQRQSTDEILFMQRIADIARKQKLPEMYLHKALTPPVTHTAPTETSNNEQAVLTPIQQNTEPLPLLDEQDISPPTLDHKQLPESWLMIFASYLVVLVLMVLTCAVLQGMGIGDAVLANNLTFLGVPWLVLMYGLLGGCISCIITLGRSSVLKQPAFIIITWFARPYVGAVLALLTYLLLTSGIFALIGSINEHQGLFLFIGALAGYCEGWIFVRKGARGEQDESEH